MSNLFQDQGKRNTARAGAVRRRRLGAWLLLGWAMFWITTAIAQPFCCISLAVGMGGDSALAQRLGDQFADHPGGMTKDDPNCPNLAVPDAISPTAAAAAADRVDLEFAPPPPDAIEPADNEPARQARHLSIPPPQHVPLYLRNQRFLI